jgi:hypothetical protein
LYFLCHHQPLFLTVPSGFEPEIPASKTGVLPLHHGTFIGVLNGTRTRKYLIHNQACLPFHHEHHLFFKTQKARFLAETGSVQNRLFTDSAHNPSIFMMIKHHETNKIELLLSKHAGLLLFLSCNVKTFFNMTSQHRNMIHFTKHTY